MLNQLHNTNRNPDQKSEECSCIIHRSFYGKLQSDVTCEGCKNVTTAHDPVMDLSLDLRPKDRKKMPQAAGAEKGIAQTVQQCLARFTATERLGVNEYNCGMCSGPREATKQLTVKRLPPVLCIQLKVRWDDSSVPGGGGGTGKRKTKNSNNFFFFYLAGYTRGLNIQETDRPRLMRKSGFPWSWT